MYIIADLSSFFNNCLTLLKFIFLLNVLTNTYKNNLFQYYSIWNVFNIKGKIKEKAVHVSDNIDIEFVLQNTSFNQRW